MVRRLFPSTGLRDSANRAQGSYYGCGNFSLCNLEHSSCYMLLSSSFYIHIHIDVHIYIYNIHLHRYITSLCCGYCFVFPNLIIYNEKRKYGLLQSQNKHRSLNSLASSSEGIFALGWWILSTMETRVEKT